MRTTTALGVLAFFLTSFLHLNMVAEGGGGQRPALQDYEYMLRPETVSEGFTDAERLYNFASRLLIRGEFSRAAHEFERFSNYHPGHGMRSEAAYGAAYAKFKEESYDEAAVLLRKLYLSAENERLKARALYLMAEADYRNGDYLNAIEIYKKVTDEFTGTHLGGRASFMVGWSHLRLSRWRAASSHFSELPLDNPYAGITESLSEESLRGLTLKLKSPLLAGLLSAYLPGAGQFYVGRKRDALFSFLINQGFILGGVVSLFSGNIFLGVTLLTLEVGWYAGNIYSALNGAYKHNRRVRDEFIGELHLKYGFK